MDSRPRPTPYSASQIRLIRQALRAYYRIKIAELGPDFGWIGVAEILFGLIKIRIRTESLRQFAKGQVSRGKRRGTDNLEAMVSFLTHPEIDAMSLEELKEPEIPYRFAFPLMEFLKHDEYSELTLPPPELEGTYRAISHSDGKILRYPARDYDFK
jgi:hypothetical protein